MKPVVGLTGGIASGKSKASQFFSEFGVPVVDADQVARKVVLPGTPGLEKIKETFGEALLVSGELDRKKMASLVFSQPDARYLLNGILHPLIAEESQRQFATLSQGNIPFILYEASLIVENGMQSMFPILVLVDVPENVQRQRLMARENLDPKEVQGRMSSQLPFSEKRVYADFILDNSKDELHLQKQVKEVFPLIQQKLRTAYQANQSQV